MKKIILIAIFLLLIPFAAAKQGSIKLLAVSEKDRGYFGSIADLSLEIVEGRGRVFIESFPLSKLDTQITTRFAKQIACNYLSIDCSGYDFFYTISAKSAIVGGPSAGAATSILTIALLEGLELDESTAITGTINSGDLIGPVGGLKQKIDAAASERITKVLIPFGESFTSEEGEKIDLYEYAESKNITLIEVSDLDEAIYEFTGEELEKIDLNFEISEDYTNTMKLLADRLCKRSQAVISGLLNYTYKSAKVLSEESLDLELQASNLTKNAEEALEQGFYYSAASFCYGAAVKYTEMYLKEKNLTFYELNASAKLNSEALEIFNAEIESREINTITDLEAYMIVKQRISEAEENLDKAERAVALSDREDAEFYLANAIERINSAYSWSEFFGKPGMEILLDREALKKSCIEKISEAEERYEYVSLFFSDMEDIKSEILQAYEELNNEKYALCLFKASIAKANADVILSTVNIEPDNIIILLAQKLDSAKKVISKQSKRGIFPIFGYSYYEYATSLKPKDMRQALVYAEYAIELSNLEMYFEKTEVKFHLNYELVWFFVLGFIAGIVFYELLIRRRKKRRKKP